MAYRKAVKSEKLHGISTPTLLEQLQAILRHYSDGQILKELLQNAEDAGATEIRFLYDENHYGTDSLLQDDLADFQGPALCSYNNAVFRDEDWEGIQKLARSGKKNDVLKVGRFGIGFSSVYHLTDLPCIISKEILAMIDPFEKYFYRDGRPTSSCGWRLESVIEDYRDQLQPFQNAMPPGVQFQEQCVLPGTLFRFPLRKVPNSLSQSVFTQEKTRDLLKAFQEDAKIVLLFLRNIERVHIDLRKSRSKKTKLVLEVSCDISSMGELRKKRHNFSRLVKKFEETSDGSCNIEMTNTFDLNTKWININTEYPTEVKETWVVSQEIALKCSSKLALLYQELKFLPWVGVAVPLFSQTAVKGRIFCFLPLPPGVNSLSGLPVHVHGFFAVSDDRRSLKWPTSDQIQNIEAEWNKLLVNEVLPQVYLKAVLKAINVTNEQNLNPDFVYNAIPDINRELGHWREAVDTFFSSLFQHRVLYCRAQNTWMSINEVVVMTQDLSLTSERSKVILKCLQKSGFHVIEDLPGHVRTAIQNFASVTHVSPSLVVRCLRIQSINEYSDKDRLYLLDYLLGQHCNSKDLAGLQLLPTDAGTFVPFTENPRTGDITYMGTSTCSQHLLPGMQRRFLINLEGRTFLNLRRTLEGMCSSENWKQLHFLDAAAVIKLLPEALPPSWSQGSEDHVFWLPTLGSQPDLQWLKDVWQFACHQLINLADFKGLKILPVSNINTTPIQMMALVQKSRVIKVEKADTTIPNFSEITRVLQRLNVKVCELPNFVSKHYQISNSTFVHTFHANGVLEALKAVGAFKIERECSANVETLGLFCSHLLPYLSGACFSHSDNQFLRNLSVFEIFQNKKTKAKNLVSLSSGVLVLQEKDFNRLPQVTLQKKYLLVRNDSLLYLLNKLGFFPQHFENVFTAILQDCRNGLYNRREIDVMFEWIRLNYDNIKSIGGVQNCLSEISFVPNGNNELKRPRDLYDVTDRFVKALIHDKSVLVSKKMSSLTWLPILRTLGLKTQASITSNDLKNAASDISYQENVSRAGVLVEYLCRYPQCLQSDSLCKALKQTAFIACKINTPPLYPKRLPFYGKQGLLCKPTVLVAYSVKTCYLLGASTPMVDVISDDRVLNRLCVRRQPSVREVLLQLQQCVLLKDQLGPHWKMLRCIYHFLNGNILAHTEVILNGLPQKWIFVGGQFMDTKSVYKEEGPGGIDLRPFLCVLPTEYREYNELLRATGVPDHVTNDVSFLVDVLETIKTSIGYIDMDACLTVSINILRRLLEFEDKIEEDIRCRLYVPTSDSPMKMLPPDQVCYDDTSYDKDGEDFDTNADEPPIYLVHNEVPPYMAKKLGVISLSKRLAGADEIGGILQTGQYEPVTVRLKNIVRDGYQPESIPKEMVQNAEDAGASQVRFLLDLRSNMSAKKRLLDPAMREVQGPALWVYNDAVFTKADLQNITKLGGATKGEDRSKIGQFGLGFNAVYHITDVPSFVTNDCITIFDPHKTHLQSHFGGEGTGIQINFMSNSRLTRFQDQFIPYEGIFGCKMLRNKNGPERYNNTLFRLPLRNKNEAKKSDICGESYDEEKMKPLLKSLCDAASQMLLFTENVKTISVHLLEKDDVSSMVLLYKVTKSTTKKKPSGVSFRDAVHSSVKMRDLSCMPQEVTSIVMCKRQWTEEGANYFGFGKDQLKSQEKWVVVMSGGKGRSFQMCLEDGLNSGLLPCGGVAWNPNANTHGCVFCFLPLSVPQSGLPVCINGSFAVSADRRSIWRKSDSDSISPKAAFKTKWNQYMLEDIIVSAYVALLQQQDTIHEYANRHGDPYFLWPHPLKTSTNSDYGKVMTGFYKAIVCGVDGETPPKVFCKEDAIYSIDNVFFAVDIIQNDNRMFPIVGRVLKQMKSKEMIKIPTWVRTGFQEAGYFSEIMCMTYSWERFFREIFLPNFKQLNDEDIISLLLKALSMHDDAVLNLMRLSKCIPTKTSHGTIYKKPSSLLDPIRFKNIFFEDEGVFPDNQFLRALDKHQKETLRGIGCLEDNLSWIGVLERAQTVKKIWEMNRDKAILRVSALLNFMDNKLQVHRSGDEHVENNLREVAFLPAVRNGYLDLQCPSNVYLAEERNLVGYVCHILDTSIIGGTLSQSVCRLLGMQGKQVKAVDVIENLRRLKEIHANGFGPNPLQKQCESIYFYLQKHLEEEDVLRFLQRETFFCVHQEFIETNRLACFSDSFPPYLFQIPVYLRHNFHPLFKAAGIKDFFDFNDFIRTLNMIKEDQNGKPLDQEMVSNILTKVIKPLFDISDKIPTEQVPQILLPDSTHMLHPSSSLSYCDLDSFKHLTSKYKLCHGEISSIHAKKLGVRDIRDQMLKKYSQNLPGCGGIGESFGQREKLVTRITRIMEGYPCDFSILKELVQNADDARATKVHFVLDERKHPTNCLFYDSMSELQGPALLAYNDRPFTDDDVKGIQDLGEGSKSNETDKTGRYGVGFNVVYHLTDCPMFISGGETFCIFDPTLQYVEDANLLCPGRMFRPIDREMLDSYSDLFNCFFSFQNDFKLQEGTLFRFPLRQKRSEISGEISPSDIKNLFTKFKDEMFDILLFLKNVTEISFSTCTKGTLDTTYTVTANLSQEKTNERKHFFRKMTQQKECTLLDFPLSDLQYQTAISDNDGRTELWLVHQRVGIANKDMIPDSVKHASTVTKLKLLPKGGVAAKLMCLKSGQKVGSKIDGKAFCFLPLPIKTNLPVHVDGYFALGHEARRNLWEAPDGDPKSDWNRLIAKEIIAPVYVLILEKIKANITDSAGKGMELRKLKDRLQHYHTLFPINFTVGRVTSLNAWGELGQEFYQKVTQEKRMLFPVVHSECWQDTSGPLSCPERLDQTNTYLLWKSCVLNSDNEGYFDDLSLQIPQTEIDREAAKRGKENLKPRFLQLRHLLLNLGFPLLETPLKIYKIMEKVLSSMEGEAPGLLTISPQSVESWLKTVAKTTSLQGLPLDLKKTRISSNLKLQLLVGYVTKAPKLKLRGLPLLLTKDGVLREFSTRVKVFHSQHHSLLPKCTEEFLHSQFLLMFKKEDDCFAVLELSDLVERLPTHLPCDQFCTGGYTPWLQNTRTKVFTPRTDWVKKLWQYLFENRGKPDWEANVVQALGNWSIFPVYGENRDIKHLVPMNLAKTVLSSYQSCYHMEIEKVLKYLPCPMVDTATLKDVGPFYVHQPAMEELCQFVMAFASNLDNVEHTLLVFERLINYRMERFKTLEKTGHQCILHYFSKQTRPLSENEKNLTILKSLPCFETIHGDFVALKGKKIYAVAIDDVPQCGQDIWLLQSGCVFLKNISHLTEFFKILGVNDLSDVELYKQFILPCFKQFSIAAQWKHLSRIIDMIRTNTNPKEIIRTLNLKNVPVVPQENGNPRLASSFCDDKNPVFKEMLEQRYFPPRHPGQKYQSLWLPFLRQIGMQTDVSYEQFEDFANKLSKEPRHSKREKILLGYFFENHHLHSDRDFLTRLAKIPFISAADTPNDLRELHEPCSTEKVTLTAVPEQHQKLVWTKEPVLPKWVYLRKCKTCGTGGYLETVLLKTKEPTLIQVFSHTQTLCCSLAKLHESSLPMNYQHPLMTHERLLNLVIIDILKFLSEKCEKAQKCETCTEKCKCCSICAQIVTALEDIPVVPLKGGEFFKAKRLTKHLPKMENDKLFLFLKKLPDHFIPYCNLLYCMGTTEEPSLLQYASTLQLIKQQSVTDQHNNPNILKAAEQAVECFFRILSKEGNDQLGAIEELFLLTNKMQSPLLRSTELYYNDEPSFASRLKCFPHPLMRTVDESALKSYLDMEKLVGKLEHLKPQLISETVDEISTNTNEYSKPNTVCECTLSNQLKQVFSWRTFFLALKIIIDNEDVRDDTEHDKMFETNFTVKCLDEIPTELRMKDGTVIPQSKIDAGVLFKRTEIQEVDVVISHSANDALIQIQIADGFNHFFGNFLKSTKFLEIVFNSKSKEDVIPNLSTMGLKTTSDELQALIRNPVLGSEIEEDVICLLIQDPFCHFSPNEYVGYNDTHGEDEHCVYAKIIGKVDDDTDITSEHEYLKVKYIIEVGGKKQIEVDAIWLYKFMPPKDKPFMPEDVKTPRYNPNGPASSSTDVAVFEGQSSQQDFSDNSDDFKDLDKTKREITKIIEDLWKQEDSIRRTTLRRLKRKWHPDKHKEEHKKFAEEVFKHIGREIERMENGIPSGVDTNDDIFRWAQRNTAAQRQYWRFHQRQYGRRGQRGWGGGGGSWNTSSSTGFNTPPSFHKINLEACRWLKQARIDLRAADTVVSGYELYFQWKSGLCFFAVEKSVKAAQLVCGCGISNKHSLMDAALKLKLHLDVTEAIQQLVQIVKRNSHYPSPCSDKSIPHENFTREHADEAMNIAQSIIRKVDNYIQHG